MFITLTLAITIIPVSTQEGIRDYDPWYDINDDGKIDIKDVAGIAVKFGTSGTPINKTALLLELLDEVNVLKLNQSLFAERVAVLEAEVDRLKGDASTFFFDTFDTGLCNWSYWGDFGYWLTWASDIAKISGDDNPAQGGMQKTVDLSQWNGSGSLILSFDWKATSDTADSSVTNVHLRIEDADSHSLLYSQVLASGGTVNTGWQSYTNDVSPYVIGHSKIKIIMSLWDVWTANWHQTNSYDNVKLTNVTAP